MTLEEAKLLRNQYLVLVGQKAKDFDAEIEYVLACPNRYLDFVVDFARNNFNDLDNDTFIKIYKSDQYFVKVVYDMGLGQFAIDDISEYKDRISGISK